MKKQVRYIILCLFFVQTLAAQKKPEWILNPPASNDFFTGVNFCSKQNPDYIAQAKSKALKDLASQIIVTINSETFLKTTEVDNEVKQTFQENIKTNVQRELEGYEQVDTWQDKEEYWIYYRLSKSAYYTTKRQKFESALNSSNAMYTMAQQMELAGDYCQAIHLYIQSTKPLEPYMGESFDAELKNKSSEIMNGAINAISTIIANSRVVAINKAVNVKSGSAYNENLNCRVVFNNTGKETIIKNFPLKYSVEKGNMDLSARKSVTNNEGLSGTVLTSCSSADKKASLRVALDLDELVKEYAEDVLICKSIKKKTCSYDLFMIELKSPTVYFASDEKNMSKKMTINVLEPAIKDLFKEMGFSFVPSGDGADYIVTIDADTRAGGQAYDLSVSYLDANILISDKSKNEQIYSKQYASIKGVKQDHIAAGNEAYRKVITANFKNEMFPELKQKFQPK